MGLISRQETKSGQENIGFWTNPEEWADWQFKVTTPGKFDLSAELGGPEAASFDLTVGESRLRATFNPTGSYDEVRIPPNWAPSRFRPRVSRHWPCIRPKKIGARSTSAPCA